MQEDEGKIILEKYRTKIAGSLLLELENNIRKINQEHNALVLEVLDNLKDLEISSS